MRPAPAKVGPPRTKVDGLPRVERGGGGLVRNELIYALVIISPRSLLFNFKIRDLFYLKKKKPARENDITLVSHLFIQLYRFGTWPLD